MFYQGLQNQAGNLFLLISFPLYVHVRASPFHKSRTKLALTLISFGKLCTYVHRYVLDLYFVPHKSSPHRRCARTRNTFFRTNRRFVSPSGCAYAQHVPFGEEGERRGRVARTRIPSGNGCVCFPFGEAKYVHDRFVTPSVRHLCTYVRPLRGRCCTYVRTGLTFFPEGDVLRVRASLRGTKVLGEC